MPEDPVADILRNCPLYAQLAPEHFDHLRQAAELRHAAAHETLFIQGDPCPGVVVLGSGLIRIVKCSASGKQHLLRVIEPGNSFLEVPVISGVEAPANAEAAGKARYVLIPRNIFRDLMHDDHEFCLSLLTGLSGRVIRLVHLMEDIVLRDAVSRLAHYFIDHADGRGEIRLLTSKKDLASHLNLTPETFSRAMRRLVDHGLVTQRARQLRIGDYDGLEQLAEGPYPLL